MVLWVVVTSTASFGVTESPLAVLGYEDDFGYLREGLSDAVLLVLEPKVGLLFVLELQLALELEVLLALELEAQLRLELEVLSALELVEEGVEDPFAEDGNLAVFEKPAGL